MMVHSPKSVLDPSSTNEKRVYDKLTNENEAKEKSDNTATLNENTDQLISKTKQSGEETNICEEVK